MEKEKYSVRKKVLKELGITREFIKKVDEAQANEYTEVLFDYIFNDSSRVYNVNKSTKRDIINTKKALLNMLDKLIERYEQDPSQENFNKLLDCKVALDTFVKSNVNKVIESAQKQPDKEM